MLEKIIDIIKEYIGNDELDISENTDFTNDLGLSSIELLDLLNKFEDEFGITIDDSDIPDIITVGELLDYISKKI